MNTDKNDLNFNKPLLDWTIQDCINLRNFYNADPELSISQLSESLGIPFEQVVFLKDTANEYLMMQNL